MVARGTVPYTPEPLTQEQIDERAFIVSAVDTPACMDCGKALPEGVAADPRWFMDVWPSGDETDEYLAHILCPRCLNGDMVQCDGCDRMVPHDEAHSVMTSGGEGTFCKDRDECERVSGWGGAFR